MRHTEHALQVAVARYLDLCLDHERTWWSSIDHGAGRMSLVAAGLRKARGVKRGIPDILLMWDSQLAGIELKSGSGHLSDAQAITAKSWLRMGFFYLVARDLDTIQDFLIARDVPMLRKMTFFPREEKMIAGAR